MGVARCFVKEIKFHRFANHGRPLAVDRVIDFGHTMPDEDFTAVSSNKKGKTSNASLNKK
jgi:hypothetical protein